jgi:hypothetical protein
MTVSSNWLTALRAYLATVAGADLVWETLHLPLYTLWRTGTVGEKIFAVVHCTFGDLLIALATLALALILVGHRDWPARRFTQVAALTLFFGLGYTIFSEWLNVIVRKSWAYSSLMPVISQGIRIWRISAILGLRLGDDWIPTLGFNRGIPCAWKSSSPASRRFPTHGGRTFVITSMRS